VREEIDSVRALQVTARNTFRARLTVLGGKWDPGTKGQKQKRRNGGGGGGGKRVWMGGGGVEEGESIQRFPTTSSRPTQLLRIVVAGGAGVGF